MKCCTINITFSSLSCTNSILHSTYRKKCTKVPKNLCPTMYISAFFSLIRND